MIVIVQINIVLSICRAALAKTNIREPRIPVISNVDAQPHSDPDTIKEILARQVYSPSSLSNTQMHTCMPSCLIVESSASCQVGIACSTEQYHLQYSTYVITFSGLLNNSKCIVLCMVVSMLGVVPGALRV